MFSKENFIDLAHQAVSAVRRIVGSSESWNVRDALSPASQVLVAVCKTNTTVDAATLEAWVNDLVRELELQSTQSATATETAAAGETGVAASSIKDEASRPLSEPALIENLEVARDLMYSCNAEEAVKAYLKKKLVAAIVQLYGNATLTQRLRNCCAYVIVGVCSSQQLLLRDFMFVCTDRLRSLPQDHNGRVLQILLASLLVEVLHQYQLCCYGRLKRDLDAETEAHCTSLIDCLFETAYSLMVQDATVASRTATASRTASGEAEESLESGSPSPPPATNNETSTVTPAASRKDGNSGEATGSPAALTTIVAGSGDTPAASPANASLDMSASDASLDITTSVVFLAVVAGVYRARPALKTYLVCHCGSEYARLWVKIASHLSKMRTNLFLSLSSRSPVSAMLEPVEYWRGEMLEGLVELCTSDSFTTQRAMVMASIVGSGSNNGSGSKGANQHGGVSSTKIGASAARAPASSSSGATAAPVVSGKSLNSGGRYQFVPIPADWETYLSRGTSAVWRLACALFPCTVTSEGINILKAVLLLLNTRHASAEALYRSTISTLALLSVANPRNAVLLSEHHFLRTIMALVNCNQPSVFPASQQVTLHFRHGEPSTSAPVAALTQTLTLTPVSTLNVNTTQLTFCFLNTLTSTTFSKATVELLMQGIKDMCSMPSSQTDVDIIENFLHGLSHAFIPHPLLFFPGDGYVSWRLKQMFPRGSGYTFTAWIYPTCVWTGGSCLYSFMDPNDTRVSLLIVADGRQCTLAVRVNKGGSDPAELVLSCGTFATTTWTHVVVNHGVALNVYINGQRLEGVHDVPYPKEKHSIMFNIGGAAELPGFLGFMSGMNISATLSEKEIAKLHAAGPAFYDPSRDCASFLTPFFEDMPSVSYELQSPSLLQQNDMITKKSAEFRWNRIELYVPTDIEEMIAPSKVAEWVLDVLKGRRTTSVPSMSAFMSVAKLSLSLLSTSMQLSTTEQLTQLMLRNYLDQLRTEVLSWKVTFPEFASLMLQSVTPRGGGKVLQHHACTQRVFDILLSCVLRTRAHGSGGANGVAHHRACASRNTLDPSDESAAGSTVASLASGNSSPPSDAVQEANATNVILRELSDCLLVKENMEMFQEDSSRFQCILNVSLYLPKECIKSVVILIEKLCRREAELRRVLLFLFTPSSISSTADTAKVWVLRMLFDIAREEMAMCEMIQESFKSRGVTLMLLLINGENHSSEAIRLLALGLLSLLMPLKSCAKLFKKNDGFDILSLALTEPRNDIPLGIRTFDALFQIAFDEFRRHQEKKPEADSIAVRLMATAHILHRQKQRDPSSSAAPDGGGGSSISATVAGALQKGRVRRPTADFLGHTPSIMVNHLGTRRGYSFEHTHDYGRVSEDFGELVLMHKGSRYHNLQLPMALKTVLCALDYLIRVLLHRLYSAPPMVISPAAVATATAISGNNITGSSTDYLATADEYPAFPTQRHESGLLSMNARAAQMDEERVVVEVLNYLDKLIEWPKHALKVMDIPWLGGLWAAVRVFFERPVDPNGATGAVTPVQSSEPGTMAHTPAVTGANHIPSYSTPQPCEAAIRRLHQDRSEFVAEVTQRCRTVIRKMVILDISMNERAQIRSIRDGEHPPRLVRIVLEEVARYFSVQKNGELLENAGTIIRNLNSLFKDVHTALHPFPPTLGVAIVIAITNISVSSSMQVRRRMKNSSLLTIRDHLAFYVLRESRRFLRLRKRSLNQLIHMNVNNANSITVLLLHLSNSIKENNVNEVEVLMTLIRQLAGADSARLRELHALLGDSKAARTLEELLSSSGGAIATMQSPVLLSTHTSQPTLSDHCASDVLIDADFSTSGGERAMWGLSHGIGSNPVEEEGGELSPGAYTLQLLEWCRTHKEAWTAIQRNAHAAMASMGLEKSDDKAQQQQISSASGSPKASAGAYVGLSDRSKREFQQLREELESELEKCKAGRK
ncbi:conserved hypothetical protein [Leishmania mexicana MHOM/GT/2001/U1103]|uniref:BEACH domain-containing protein n=1 Tax=Leishmania mexicana (strain MHOM/GT/2001/U1103) TaxID=929439 RepID=E9B640_LEIMU|nr:conserved hypothetical protein [Leishmania mexicana MHOM/GT/2001/U1103]CBZ30711.1 conserved hypothetical protein [Leishmania mexicana MHOM/GT/2001/U1103]